MRRGITRKEDEKKLDEILQIVGEEIERIVKERFQLFRKELLSHFPGPLATVSDRIDLARDAVPSLDWVYVDGVGLTGRELAMKHGLLKAELEEGGKLEAFMKRANSILGSFAKVLPILEPVKEYKEHVECSINEIQKITRKGGIWQRTS